jgi:hypothetical protein
MLQRRIEREEIIGITIQVRFCSLVAWNYVVGFSIVKSGWDGGPQAEEMSAFKKKCTM